MYERATHKPRLSTRKEYARVIPLHPMPLGSGNLVPPRIAPLLPPEKNVMDTSLHALLNCLQTVGIGVELLHLTQPFDEHDHDRIQQNIERAGRLALELREYCFPPAIKLGPENLATVIEEAVQEGGHEWERPGRTTRVISHAPLAEPELDWQCLTKIVRRTVFCAHAILPPEGGEVVIESNVHNLRAQQVVTIRVQSHGETPLSVEEKTLFCPFACINGHQLGLNLILVQQTVARLQGQFSFQKTSLYSGCFTFSFRASVK